MDHRWLSVSPHPIVARFAQPIQLAFLFGFGACFSSAGASALGAEVNFSRDIRPILSDKCFQCHGPDESQRQGGLRLDIRESAIAPADSGTAAIVPNQIEASELLKRIVSHDDDLVMPPKAVNKALTKDEVELLRRWIAEGAKYEGHWAFAAVTRPAVPNIHTEADANETTANATEWSKHPIDRFLFARMQQEQLSPNPRADKATLIRRAALDLTGLPPTTAQVERYLADESPQAYERMLDEFFASPHYGERMALNWLDFARYADSNGYQSDGSRDMWGWRDWVIKAYNQNIPFDQFTIEQLAGDMLPQATEDQVIASGFNRNHRLNGEGGRIEAEWFVETVIDRVETTGLTWLGLTFNCCRCHDHKYDPISQKEFYQLFAFFNSVEESGVLAPSGKNGENTPPLFTLKTEAHRAEIAKREAEIAAIETELKLAREQLPELTTAWAAKVRGEKGESASVWRTPTPSSVTSAGGATLTRQDDGTFLASGKNPANDIYHVAFNTAGESVSGMLLEVFPDKSLPNESLGRGFNGNFVMTDFDVRITGGTLSEPLNVKLVRAQADFSQASWPAEDVLKNAGKVGGAKDRQGWAIEGNNPERRLARKLMFVAESPIAIPAGSEVVIRFGNSSQFGDHNIGRFRLSLTSVAPAQITLDTPGVPADVLSALDAEPQEWNDKVRKAVQGYFSKYIPNPVREKELLLETKRKGLKEFIEDLPVTMVMKEGKPRDAFVLVRGEYDKPSDKVGRAVPAVLPPLPPGATTDRLGFAQWIAHRDNPLTARVWVNREWERFFGIGIVKTTENLGSQAEYPVHPQLLDWLAAEFMEPTVLPAVNGQAAKPWDMKAMQKLIMLSAAYQQSTRVTPEKLDRDTDNRLLARGPRFRLPGEVVRDCALSASGLLVNTVGGPSARPYMPAGVWDETSKYGNLRNYKPDQGDGLYRRSMYTIWKRTAAPPTMLLFDAPNREVCTVKRSRTNTPLQALSLLNEITFIEAARNLAVRMLREGGETAEQRIAHGFRLAVSRVPTNSEMPVLLAGLDADMRQFAENPSETNNLLALGESKTPAELPQAELAAYTLAANVILNLDEFVTRE